MSWACALLMASNLALENIAQNPHVHMHSPNELVPPSLADVTFDLLQNLMDAEQRQSSLLLQCIAKFPLELLGLKHYCLLSPMGLQQCTLFAQVTFSENKNHNKFDEKWLTQVLCAFKSFSDSCWLPLALIKCVSYKCKFYYPYHLQI